MRGTENMRQIRAPSSSPRAEKLIDPIAAKIAASAACCWNAPMAQAQSSQSLIIRAFYGDLRFRSSNHRVNHSPTSGDPHLAARKHRGSVTSVRWRTLTCSEARHMLLR